MSNQLKRKKKYDTPAVNACILKAGYNHMQNDLKTTRIRGTTLQEPYSKKMELVKNQQQREDYITTF